MSFDPSLHQNREHKKHDYSFNVKKFKVYIVMSLFNREICEATLQSVKDELIFQGVQEKNIEVLQVPGALEIPIVMNAIAKKKGSGIGLIAIGCIIRGETYHFEIVADNSAQAIMSLATKYNVAVSNAIITTENMEQAHARKVIKGEEAVLAMLATENHLYNIRRDKLK